MNWERSRACRRTGKAGGAACKATRPLWGAEGSFAGLTVNVPKRGIILP